MPVEFALLSALLEEESSLYAELEELVEEQMSCIERDDVDGLFSVLARKQEVIARQEELVGRWREIASALGLSGGRESPSFWRELGDHLDEGDRAALGELVLAVRETLSRLIEKEANSRDLLSSKIALIREHMLAVERGRGMLKGYGEAQGVSSVGSQLDRRS